MPNEHYVAGYACALQSLGLEKTAYIRGLGRILTTAKTPARMSGKDPWSTKIKKFLIGEPTKFYREVTQGRAFKPNSLIRQNAEDMRGVLGKTMMLGFPAYNMGSIALDKDPNKIERISGELGGAILGTALWRPLGMLGSMAGYTLGDKLMRYPGRGLENIVN